ncbi:probable protein phosphatase 2C 80 [Rhodamnia argentea]|uniref:Protein phosphatase n=1 Tax=Rhodamnia argentea TaxID=178133 RepID=A0A8B8QT71_9MYRT|nr:probable protein phosphatase 2C 80 [Rhodamnia argentea]
MRFVCCGARGASKKGKLRMIAGSCYLPRKRAVYPDGDDAHFICSEKSTIGVSDGVGSWVRSGVDPGEYARGLMTSCADEVGKWEAGCVDLEFVLNAAFDRTLVRGSATACLLTLADDVVNVGDSGFVRIRRGESVYRSPLQEYGFNCPYQLGRKPGHSSPGSAQSYKVEVRKGDIIVAGTDGLFDNMFVDQIKDAAEAGIRAGKDLGDIASSIAARAHANSLDKATRTPFSKGMEEHGKEHRWGKADDITVIVARIVRD